MVRDNGLNTNLSAEFFIASQLFRKGYVVAVTYGNTKEIDLVVHNAKGKMITIDVKGLKNSTNWPVKKRKEHRNHYYILVNYKNKLADLDSFPEVYIIPGIEIKKYLSPWSGRPEVTAVAYSKVKESKYKDAWDLLFSK